MTKTLRRGRGVLFGGLVALAVVLLLLPGVRARARSIVDPSDPTSSERWLMWRSGLAMARAHLFEAWRNQPIDMSCRRHGS